MRIGPELYLYRQIRNRQPAGNHSAFDAHPAKIDRNLLMGGLFFLPKGTLPGEGRTIDSSSDHRHS